MRGKQVVAVIITLAVAGCMFTGGVSNQSNTSTYTADSGNNGSLTPPPGVNRTGVTNPTSLFDAHEGALDNRSYSLIYTKQWNNSTASIRTQINERTREMRVQIGQTHRNESIDIYQNDSIRFEAKHVGNSTKYRITESQFSSPGFVGPKKNILYLMRHVDYDSARVVKSADTKRIKYDIKGFRGKDIANGSVTITSDGILREFNLKLTDENQTVRYRFRTTDIGSTDVTKPGWTDRARKAVEEQRETTERGT